MTNTKLHSYDRIDNDAYYTLDAPRLVPLLAQYHEITGKVHEPAAGAGHLTRELAKLEGVTEVIETDIETGTRIEELDGSINPDWVISNLPYKNQDSLIEHLLNIYPSAHHAYLVRWNYLVSKNRDDIIHSNPRFAGVVVSAKRPRWIEGSTGSPAVNYCWAIWRPIDAPQAAPTMFFEGATQ